MFEKGLIRYIGEKRVYTRYFKESFLIGKAYLSPFRREHRPSFCIYKEKPNDNHWYEYKWKDFGTNEQGDCVEFVMKKYGISRRDALETIMRDFNIDPFHLLPEQEIGILLSIFNAEEPEIVEPSEDIELEEYKPFKYRYIKQGFTPIDEKFWYDFGIPVSVLNIYGVSSVSEIQVSAHPYETYHRYKAHSERNPIYVYEINDRYKLYIPFSIPKFIGTVKGSDIHEHIITDDKLVIITKSLKDLILYNQMGFNAISGQSENTYIKKEMLKAGREYVIIYDNDEAGRRGADELSRRLGVKKVFLPLGNFKDPSDFIKSRQDKEAAKQELKEIIEQCTIGKKSYDLSWTSSLFS
jgi:hypothetical protein